MRIDCYIVVWTSASITSRKDRQPVLSREIDCFCDIEAPVKTAVVYSRIGDHKLSLFLLYSTIISYYLWITMLGSIDFNM